MGFKLDFSNAPSGFEPVPQGEYVVYITDIEKRTAKSGSVYLNWKLKIADGPQIGRVIFMTTSLLPNAMWKLLQVIEAVLNRRLTPEERAEFDFEPQDFLGKQCGVRIVHRTYTAMDGTEKMQDEVAAVLPASQVTVPVGTGLQDEAPF